jgi:energy-coupling factor transport system substrate-specific component
MRTERWLSAAILTLATVVGLVAFGYPFLALGGADSGPFGMAHAQDAPLVTLILTLFCVVTVVANLTSQQMSARTIAVLGVLTAVNAALRAIPGPAGFSAIFFLIGLCGYVYGATFGFLLGTLSLLVSALMGGGVGPWLPYQMFATGWMGMTSAWLPDLRRWRRAELLLLVVWTALWGLVFGAIMNVWFWPYLTSFQVSADHNWELGLRVSEVLKRYLAFYVATSLWWDMGRSLGNAGLVLFLGIPLLKVLRRFEHVLGFEVESSEAGTERCADGSGQANLPQVAKGTAR